MFAEVLARGISTGDLQGTAEQPLVATNSPTRELLLAAMQQHGIKLPSFDCIISDPITGGVVPVEQLWREMSGGPCLVSGAVVWWGERKCVSCREGVLVAMSAHDSFAVTHH